MTWHVDEACLAVVEVEVEAGDIAGYWLGDICGWCPTRGIPLAARNTALDAHCLLATTCTLPALHLSPSVALNPINCTPHTDPTAAHLG